MIRLNLLKLVNRSLFQVTNNLETKFIKNINRFSYKNNQSIYFNFNKIFKSSAILLAFFPFFGFKEEPKETAENLMARSIAAIENNELDESISILHRILTLITDAYDNNEITKTEYEGKRARVFSEIGNVYMLKGELETASKLLIETMRSCFLAEIQPSNPMIVELSLKLALIYEQQKNYDDSDMGFRFCVNNCLVEYEKSDLEESERENVTALLGMCYNYYSKFLYKMGKYTQALSMCSKSVELALQIYDKNHPNIVNLINDQAVIYLGLKDFTSASCKFQEAINICLQYPEDELMRILPFIYANVGHLYLEIGEIDKAEEMCINSEKYWRSNITKEDVENEELEIQVKDCFMKLAGVKSEQRED